VRGSGAVVVLGSRSGTDLMDDFRCGGRWSRFDRQAVHDVPVAIDVGCLVDVHSAGELSRKTTSRISSSAKRSILTKPGCRVSM